LPEHLHAIVLAAGDGERALRSTKNALAFSDLLKTLPFAA
jgi:hypothetical protein